MSQTVTRTETEPSLTVSGASEGPTLEQVEAKFQAQTKEVRTRQSRKDAAHEARQFVYDRSLGMLNTVNRSGPFVEFPSSQIEYFSDLCDEVGGLLMIKVDMSSAFRNISMGSKCSISISWMDSPGTVVPVEIQSRARIILFGEFENYEPSEADKERYFTLHPDARSWAPGKLDFHKTEWMRFIITGIYYIGGFGDKHYIGKIPLDKYLEYEPHTQVNKSEAMGGAEAAKGFLSRWLGR